MGLADAATHFQPTAMEMMIQIKTEEIKPDSPSVVVSVI